MPDIDYMQKLAELLAKNFPTSHSKKMLSDFVQSENNVIDVEPIEKTKLDEFVEWAAHYKIAAGTIRRFVDKNGEQAFEEVQAAFIKNLEDAKIGKAKPVKNKTNLLGAYLRDAIGVKSEEERKSAEERSVKMNLAKEHAKLKEQIKYLEDQKNELQRIHRERCLQIASKLFAGLDKDYEQTLADQFLASMDNDFERRDFEVRRWGALMTMHKIIDFARKQFPRKLPTFASVVKKETGKTLKSLDADIEKLRQKLSDE